MSASKTSPAENPGSKASGSKGRIKEDGNQIAKIRDVQIERKLGCPLETSGKPHRANSRELTAETF
jgi:hypothetical protein